MVGECSPDLCGRMWKRQVASNPVSPCLRTCLDSTQTHEPRPLPSPIAPGALLSRGRVTVAGGIISAIGLFMTLIGLGIKDEVDPQLYSQRMGARTGETKGGVFTHPGQEESNVVSYNNPLAPVSE